MEDSSEIMINIDNSQLSDNMQHMDVNDQGLKLERANVDLLTNFLYFILLK